jgi:PAS domain S-box-containing protein
MFRLLFERSGDAIILFDPQKQAIVDCNAAAVTLMRASSKECLLHTHPKEIAPARQPDGRLTQEAVADITALVERNGGHRFEWLARRFDGSEVPLEITATSILAHGRALHVIVSRDISERKTAEDQIRQLNATLEQRVAVRTAELAASEARLRTLVEHAPEAIVVLDNDAGCFTTCNDHATRLFGLSREELMKVGPVEVSPELQPDGRSSADAARHWLEQALAGDAPAFEWTHRHADGRLFSCEIRLVLLPGEKRRLTRASIIDTTERRRRERLQQAMFQISEAAHAARDPGSLYARIHEIIRGLLAAKNFYIALLDPATELISFPYFVDEFGVGTPDPRRITTGLTGEVLRTGKPLLVTRSMLACKRQVGEAVIIDGVTELPFVEVGRPAACWVGVPLLFGNRALGVMAAQDYRDETVFGEDEKAVLVFIAEQTALAIERKQAEEALRESEQKFRALFEATSTGVMIHDEEKFLEVNPAAVRITGYETAGQILGKHPRDFAPPTQPGGESSAVAAARHIAECMEKGSTRFEWTNRSPNGGEIPMEVVLTRIEMGGRHLFQAVVTDISERKRVEETLQQRHREVVTLLDSLPGYAFFKDAQGHYVMANQNFCRALDQTSETIVGKTDHDLFPVELATKYRADDARLLVSRETLQVGEEKMIEGGRTFYVQTTKVPVKNECGEVVGLIGLGFDITERKRAEEELRTSAARLRESEARFRSAFYNSPVRTSIARVDDGRFIEVNDAFLEGLGLPRSEVIGKTSIELGIWPDPAQRAAFWDELQRQRAIRHREVTLRDQHGGLYTMLLSADIVEIRDEPHVLVNALDITERKQAEQELLRALAREKELSQLKSSFVSLVSHEFRTPLGVISSSAEILRDYLVELPDPERREHLDSIARNTRHMSELMEEVLVLGRLDAGKIAFDRAPLDLTVLCRRLVDEVLSATNHICPIVLTSGSLPADARADERLLRHILINLLANAVKYSEPGEAVDFDVACSGTDAVFTIRDSGMGIPEADQARLFNAFQRGGNVGTRHGTGLGLVIVKRCVDLHRGRVQLTSRLGEGTAVTVRLPVFLAEVESNLS